MAEHHTPQHNLGSMFLAHLPELGAVGQTALAAQQAGTHLSPQAQTIASTLVLLAQIHAAPQGAQPHEIPTEIKTTPTP